MTEKQLEKKILDGGRTLLFSNEDLKRLIIPLVIDQVLVRTVGMADTMMISSVGEAAISGVSLVDMINMLINAIFAAVATGGAVIASQYLGHRDRKKACEASSQLMVVTAVCALLFTVLSLAARKPLLSLLFGQIDADVMDAALTYLTVSALSFPFLASFNSSSALFRAMNDSRTPTVVSLGMNVMNLIGNSILIFGMKWGVAGAAMNLAILTVVGRCVGAHDNDQVRYYTRKLLKIEYAMMVVVNVVLLAALPLILNLYTLSPASRELATQLIFIHDGFAMLLWPLALSMPNALRAANDVKFTMVLSIGSMVCFRIALSYVVGVKMGYGALGVWFAMLVDWAVRAAVYTWRFEKGKWESMARI